MMKRKFVQRAVVAVVFVVALAGCQRVPTFTDPPRFTDPPHFQSK